MNKRMPQVMTTDGALEKTRPEFRLHRPRAAEVTAFRMKNERAALSYDELGQSASGYPAGYHVDHNSVRLGRGEETWTRACEALKTWQMFPKGWAAIEPADETVRAGQTLTMLARGYGVWWMSGCRIVYMVEEAGPVRRFGFAYGTLTTHVEQGEERFMAEMLEDGTVWYDLRAFSRPRFWPVKLMKPLARRLQKRFVRESLAAMVAATTL
ncbi:DUF1990 domain-containing protein [Nibricoccus aquaticus]|uniref:DUF1990 domain-containing protein n=1 Tax=Nibricoccus aquaticus TaxID=2576891 RepID=A0A290QGS2_9BACT|nr:DUF1990 domain-containing protein [Nibricoccus aquaticus]ATC63082.1 DUF1990 domain-containing protein [Nibricoccus aquaticus]